MRRIRRRRSDDSGLDADVRCVLLLGTHDDERGEEREECLSCEVTSDVSMQAVVPRLPVALTV